eukprot:CAMPEP_0176377562 /NCGR_PEP_ID=MMETSP0126-20121128/28979_1 /TAXON_ID=141414 ORGANISM="Strombidinopsis acuminatum, Strain SPMC142" /NCGR_SAMPLE_ID=MMETSP0126 /ASSEMBLY_ACC=CAM_ASM_000229 /LENGTH=114 /DNA_ID=CAMNT_0017739457 /DNA_START=164 /DNA_END=508 /DNA_ORIENTATION=-
MTMMSPMERKDRLETRTKPGRGPCEGVPQNKVHFMATPGSRNLILWDIDHPAVDANCTIRFGTSPQMKDFEVLRPLDGSADEEGKFPCGRKEIDLTGVEVKFPNTTCENCIISI